jgi:hypothetical protein
MNSVYYMHRKIDFLLLYISHVTLVNILSREIYTLYVYWEKHVYVSVGLRDRSLTTTNFLKYSMSHWRASGGHFAKLT